MSIQWSTFYLTCIHSGRISRARNRPALLSCRGSDQPLRLTPFNVRIFSSPYGRNHMLSSDRFEDNTKRTALVFLSLPLFHFPLSWCDCSYLDFPAEPQVIRSRSQKRDLRWPSQRTTRRTTSRTRRTRTASRSPSATVRPPLTGYVLRFPGLYLHHARSGFLRKRALWILHFLQPFATTWCYSLLWPCGLFKRNRFIIMVWC